jgi:hypothetical protein
VAHRIKDKNGKWVNAKGANNEAQEKVAKPKPKEKEK